jgi:hypothetical protein
MEAHGQTMKIVYTVVDRGGGKSFWTRVGVGFVNRDGSITLKLDAVPVNGTLQVREWEPRDDSARRHGDGDGDGAGGRPRARRDEPLVHRRPSDTEGPLV